MSADFSQVRRFMSRLVSAAERLEGRLKTVAHRRARAMQTAAQGRVRVATGATRDGIVVVDDSARRQFRVEAQDVPGRNPMVPVWIEFGTSKMPARPFWRPAIEASREPYVQEADAVLQQTLTEAG